MFSLLRPSHHISTSLCHSPMRVYLSRCTGHPCMHHVLYSPLTCTHYPAGGMYGHAQSRIIQSRTCTFWCMWTCHTSRLPCLSMAVRSRPPAQYVTCTTRRLILHYPTPSNAVSADVAVGPMQDILDYHNMARDFHHAGPLVWDDTLMNDVAALQAPIQNPAPGEAYCEYPAGAQDGPGFNLYQEQAANLVRCT
jgi:hypothetical protein